MVDVELPQSFTDSTSGFSWASLQFDLFGDGSPPPSAAPAAAPEAGSNSSTRRRLNDTSSSTPGLQDDAIQVAATAGGANKYLAGLKQSAESFFLSTLIVQASTTYRTSPSHPHQAAIPSLRIHIIVTSLVEAVALLWLQAVFAGVIVIAHLILNHVLKKKLGKVPASLAFPKFEAALLMAFFESICQTCNHAATSRTPT